MDEDFRDEMHKELARIPLGIAPRFDLACVGTSLTGLGAFSFDALACLLSAEVVYCYPPTPKHFELMQQINKNAINIHETLYVRGSDFDPTYNAIVDEVMRTVRNGKKVAYAVQGSPAFHCGTAIRLHRIAKREGFSSVLISGISSFELLSAELSVRYDIGSIQLYSIVKLMKGTLAIDVRVPCLLFDVGRYALPAVRETANAFLPSNLAALAERLSSIYSPDHEIFLMFVHYDGCRTFKTNPADLANALTNFTPGVTIFLPPMQPRASE